MAKHLSAFLFALLLAPITSSIASASANSEFRPGFKALHDLIPDRDLVVLSLRMLILAAILAFGTAACGSEESIGEVGGSEESLRQEPTPTPTPQGISIDCNDERFLNAIVELSEENENQLAPRILKIYSEVEELERTDTMLRCGGEVRLNRGGDAYITYYYEIDRDGDGFIGYELGESPPTPTPESSSRPNVETQGPGTYRVGEDIQPGIYRGEAGLEIMSSCYWARLKGVSGKSDDVLANDNAIGQFYVEVLSTDAYLEVGCEIAPLEAWPQPDSPYTTVKAGTHLVGRDIAPGTYRGKAGSGIMSSCYWARLRDLTGELDSVISNDNAQGQFFVTVEATDIALATGCELQLEN